VAFECVGHFENLRTATNATQGIKTLLEKIKKKEMLWKDSSFERMLKIEQEEDEFLETPLEVAEGAIKCKCGSERVYSFSKQTRSGDESTTVFALCTACKSKWVL
jgi:DNA-directed RNA polymerase subunit M/transcription elongation factor TFIIS